jgi:hypothetical protein
MKELTEITGHGDTLRVGDVFTETDWPDKYPLRLVGICMFDEDTYPSVQARKIDDGPLMEQATGSTCMGVQGPGWKSSFKKLTQTDVDAWFKETKHIKDGWHNLPYGAQVYTESGVPLRVKRRHRTTSSWRSNIKLVTELAGQFTGYDIVLIHRYSDRIKLVREVRSTTRREPPQV